MKKGSGIGVLGLVGLLIAMGVVLSLVAKQWKSVAPTVMELNEGSNSVVVETHGQDEAGQALRQGQLPGLNQMRQATDAHALDVQAALADAE